MAAPILTTTIATHVGVNLLLDKPKCGVCGDVPVLGFDYVPQKRYYLVRTLCEHKRYHELNRTSQDPRPSVNVEDMFVDEQLIAGMAGVQVHLKWPHDTCFNAGAGKRTELDARAFMAGKYHAQKVDDLDVGPMAEPTGNARQAWAFVHEGAVIVGPFDQLEVEERGVVLTVQSLHNSVGERSIRYRRERDGKYIRKVVGGSDTVIVAKGES